MPGRVSLAGFWRTAVSAGNGVGDGAWAIGTAAFCPPPPTATLARDLLGVITAWHPATGCGLVLLAPLACERPLYRPALPRDFQWAAAHIAVGFVLSVRVREGSDGAPVITSATPRWSPRPGQEWVYGFAVPGADRWRLLSSALPPGLSPPLPAVFVTPRPREAIACRLAVSRWGQVTVAQVGFQADVNRTVRTVEFLHRAARPGPPPLSCPPGGMSSSAAAAPPGDLRWPPPPFR